MASQRPIRSIVLAQLYGPLQSVDAEPLSVSVLARAVSNRYPEIAITAVTVSERLPGSGVRECATRILETRPDAIGLSCPQGTYAVALSLLEEIYSTSDLSWRPLVLLGHALPTHAPDLFLKRFPDAIAVRGWGEGPLLAILEPARARGTRDLASVAGISFVRDGPTISTPVDDLRFTWETPLRMRGTIPYFRRVEASRGCHYGRCTFCTRPPGKPDSWMPRDEHDVLQDVASLQILGVNRFTFTDEDFLGYDRPRAFRLARRVAELGKVDFSISVRADNLLPGDSSDVSDRIRELDLLRQSGLTQVFIGVESLSDSQLRRYGKGSRAQTAVRAFEILRRAGMEIEIGLVPFDPNVLPEELAATSKTLLQTGMSRCVGSPFSKLRLQLGAPMLRSLSRGDGDASLDPETLTVPWLFNSDHSQGIYAQCIEWWSLYESLYWSARNVVRVRQADGVSRRLCQTFVESLRDTGIRLLYFLALGGADDDLRAETSSAMKDVERRVDEVRAHVMPSGSYDLGGDALDDLRRAVAALSPHPGWARRGT
jgi:Radical SAM superfamily/B12 binding domain